MTEDEIRFIKGEIERSGFPLEIEVSSILKEDGWEVLPSSPYFDEDEEKWREIDIKAYKSTDMESQGKSIKPYRLSLVLIVECKKSEEFAWVFFLQPRGEGEVNRGANLVSLDFLTVAKRQSLLKEELTRTRLLPSPSELRFLNIDPSLLSEESILTPDVARRIKFLSELDVIPPRVFRCLAKEMKAIAYKEIKLQKKKSKSPPSEIFEAVNELIKAVKHELMLSSTGIYASAYLVKRGSGIPAGRGAFEIVILIPALIFDGKLYSWLNGNVKKEDEILLEGRCHTRRYFENVLINVMRKDHFRKFLREINEDFVELADHIYENKRRLDKQIEMIVEG